MLDSICLTLANSIDLTSGGWDFTDDEGLPARPTSQVIRTVLFNIAMDQALEEAKGQIPFDSTGWDEVSIPDFLDGVAEAYATEQKYRTEVAEELARRDATEALPGTDHSLEEWQGLHPAPAPQPYGISPAGAERWICDWMIHMGAADATTTPVSGDGGIDIVATGYVAQVKLYSSPAAIAEIRELVGAAAVLSEAPRLLFFCSGGFPAQAESFADAVGMSLFQFKPETGEVTASNQNAEALLRTGLLI
ncbi:restriction endonuclease [Microbacterium sp. KUDC0406]|uniref:restriction endonuclease n=1 Tax=Microbacterium sp. KUDC0406 TaxID=2909588 RepID=UPI001F303372|nr:restriction endonuclease [Microbacterium sp. KUDC0406]UJP09790.1 restriction endonuclease [Microbacterium sp. KUDC0406]